MRLEIPKRFLTESEGKYAGNTVSTGTRTVVKTLIKKEWCIGTLLPGWLKEVIALESFVPEYELEDCRCFDRHKDEILRQCKIQSF